jgi:hypothetical protein
MLLILECPNCQDYFIVDEKEINCAIFRHAMFRNGTMVNSHESKQNLEKLKSEDLIYGCGKPFKIVKQQDKYITEICDYI